MDGFIAYAFVIMSFFISILSVHIIRRRRWEDALRSAHEKLQNEIELHKKTEKEKEKIQEQLLHTQKLEAIGRLAGGIAHDFNNLLTVILGYSDLIIDEVSKEDTVYDLALEIKQVAKQAATLPRQLLAFSRKQVLQSQVIEVNNLLKKINSFLGSLIPKSIRFDIFYSEGDAYIKVDPSQIEQVIMNLVLNACDAMPEGGKLAIGIDKVNINPRISEFMVDAVFGDFVCISLRDNGVGIDKQTLPHIFEPFFTTKQQKGTGLGLAVVYGIVKQHDGWIHVESAIGKGTIIKVFLPFYKNVCCYDEKAEGQQDMYQGSGEKILLVEDDVSVCRFTSKILERNGYQVYKAHSAEEALDIFTREKTSLDLVFSDIVLPKQDGFQLVLQLTEIKPKLKVILTTGYADLKTQTSCLNQKNFQLLKKPYNVSDLLFTIRHSIRNVNVFNHNLN